MIAIKRPATGAPAAFLQMAEEETKAAIAHFTNLRTRSRKFSFTAYSHKDLKAALEQMFHGKCAYCEWRYGGGSYFEVEHYRPKSHYYWLAAEWTNLLPSCKRCNNLKLNRFPLADPKKQAKKKGQEVREDPLLLNPCEPGIKPQLHLEFSSTDGAIKPRLQKRKGHSKKGEESINVYRLARADLSLERKEWAIRVRDKIEICRLAALNRDPTRQASAYDGLRTLLQPSQPFRALTLQILREEGFGS